MKNCMTIPIYFGKRRRTFKSEYDVLELAEYQVENHKAVDPGVEMDLIFINNSLGSDVGDGFLSKINGEKTKTGKIIVIEGNNIGLSFGAHNLAYEKYNDQYDYWFFTEDDVIFNLNGFYKNFIDHLDSDKNLAFVAAHGVSKGGSHAHGGIGCTHKTYLKKAYDKHGCLPHYNKETPVLSNYKETHIKGGEIPFTNCYVKMGYTLQRVRGKKPYIRWDHSDGFNLNNIDMEEWGDASCVKNN